MSFFGYVRPDGSVGTRNYVLVIPQGFIAKAICDFVPGARSIVTTNSGSGRTANDRETLARLLIGLGRNPNVASVIVHAGSPSARYPELKPERLACEIAASGMRVEMVDSARDGGTYGAIGKRRTGGPRHQVGEKLGLEETGRSRQYRPIGDMDRENP